MGISRLPRLHSSLNFFLQRSDKKKRSGKHSHSRKHSKLLEKRGTESGSETEMLREKVPDAPSSDPDSIDFGFGAHIPKLICYFINLYRVIDHNFDPAD